MLPTFWELVLTEGRNHGYRRGPVGGAFGRGGKPQQNKRPQPQPEPEETPTANTLVATQVAMPGTSNPGRAIGNYTHTRDQQRNLQGPNSYDQRVAFGRTQEEKILKAAQEAGLDIQPAEEYEDKYLKIDGWWSNGGKKIPIQIKYRDTGDDLLFEVLKPFNRLPLLSDKNRLGRDVKPAGRAANEFSMDIITGPQYLFHLNRSGTSLSIVDVKPCYKIIYEMMSMVDQRGWTNGRDTLRTAKGELKLRHDGSSGVPKVMAYIPIASVGAVKQIAVNINIG